MNCWLREIHVGNFYLTLYCDCMWVHLDLTMLLLLINHHGIYILDIASIKNKKKGILTRSSCGASVLAKCCFSFHYDIKWQPECNTSFSFFYRTWMQYLTTADEMSDCDDGFVILSSVLWFLFTSLNHYCLV